MERHHITDESCKIRAFVRHLWPLSNEGSLTCNPYTATQGFTTPVVNWLAVELSKFVCMTLNCFFRDQTPDPLHARQTLCHWSIPLRFQRSRIAIIFNLYVFNPTQNINPTKSKIKGKNSWVYDPKSIHPSIHPSIHQWSPAYYLPCLNTCTSDLNLYMIHEGIG